MSKRSALGGQMFGLFTPLLLCGSCAAHPACGTIASEWIACLNGEALGLADEDSGD